MNTKIEMINDFIEKEKQSERVNPKIHPEQLRKWAETQYVINIEKGWHKPEYDVFHYLCLIMTEVSEVVDADRKQRHASHEICLLEGVEDDDTFFSMYEVHVKGTIDEELADVCLRTIELGYKLYGSKMEWGRRYDDYALKHTVTKTALDLVRKYLGDGKPEDLAATVSMLYGWADVMDVDLNLNVSLKLRFNGIMLRKGTYKKY